MPDPADDSLIDVTGLFVRLTEAMQQEITDIRAARPAPTIYRFDDYEPPSLAKFYKEKLSLTARQIS